MAQNEGNTAKTAEEILDTYDLHWTYYPNGNYYKEPIHDSDCTFCKVEDSVLEAMEEYAQYSIRQKLFSFIQYAKATHVLPIMEDQIEGLINNFIEWEKIVGDIYKK